MKIAVSGANGHIGANLCRKLIEQGHQVRALVHRNDQGIRGLPLDLIQGDLMNLASLFLLVEDTEIVFHLAAVISIKAKRKDEIFEKNVRGTENIIKAAQKARVRRFIHFSTIHALEHQPFDQPLDECRPLAIEDNIIYSQSKAQAEEIMQESIKAGLDAVILNPTAVIGPYDFTPSLLGRALIQMYLGKLPALVQGGYDWVDVRDVVNAAISSIEKGKTGQRYILSGHWRSMRDLALSISMYSQKKPPHLSIPIWLAQIALPFLRLYCKVNGTEPLYTRDSLTILQMGHKNISHKKASIDLAFSSRPIEHTIKDTIDWFRENGFLTA